MNIKQIEDIYREMGIGSREERERFLQWQYTGRNVIVYYSGWLQKPNAPDSEVNDSDKNRFMAVIHGLERDKGLDLFLHTPGGDIAATESLIDYLRAIFDDDIRVFIPQLAMSAGTMIACAAKVISVHHVCIHTLSSTTVCKLIANHKGKAVIQRLLMPS
ncbi:MAG: SDH family Clp fold serine proteinase [Salinispira sp.]